MTATATLAAPADPGIEPGRDPRVEAMLERHGVEWLFEPAYPLADIDTKRSLANQARADGEPLITETVELYAHHYREGVTFPGLLLRRTSPRARKTYNLGGNHRTAAAITVGLDTHPAYVVVCTDEAATSLMYEDNMANGAQLPKKQRLAIAAHLVATGWTQANAAREMGVAEMEVSTFRKLADTTRRAIDLQIPAFDELPQGIRLDLGRIPSDPVFAEAAKLVVATKMKGDDAAALIKTVKLQRSDTAALTLIGRELEERRDQVQRAHTNGKAGKFVKKTAYGKARNAISDLLSVNPDDIVLSMPASTDRAALREKCRLAAKRLMAIAEQA